MSDSKRSSKSDLNESNMPLIEDEKKEKEELEMKEGEEKGEKDSKKKKEKKVKEKKEKGPGCVQTMSSGLNVRDRDDKSINVEIDVSFKTCYYCPYCLFDSFFLLNLRKSSVLCRKL